MNRPWNVDSLIALEITLAGRMCGGGVYLELCVRTHHDIHCSSY